MTFRYLHALALIALISGGEGSGSPVVAQTASSADAVRPTPTDLRWSLVGLWSGTLGYRDYQSDRLIEIPVTTTIEALPDGVTMIRRSRYDDGPDKTVWITTVSLDDRIAGTETSASFRAGRAVDRVTETMTVRDIRDTTHWTMVYRSVGIDGDAPADIRVTETLEDETLTAIKDVRPVGAADDAWAFRNRTQLTRVRSPT